MRGTASVAKTIQPGALDHLTPMETHLRDLMVETSLPYRDLALIAGLSFESTKTITKRILHKCDASTRLELLVNHWKEKIDG
jgi:DNA-binding CsgD family transcriptional regulator